MRIVFGVKIPDRVTKPWYCKYCGGEFETAEVKILDRWNRLCPVCSCIVVPVDALVRMKEMFRRIF